MVGHENFVLSCDYVVVVFVSQGLRKYSALHFNDRADDYLSFSVPVYVLGILVSNNFLSHRTYDF